MNIMGTRSLTIMFDENDKEIAVLYRQFDGYPSGHGKELCDFLTGFKVVNGIDSTQGKVANGGGCLAAQIIAFFKREVGGFYLYPAGTRKVWEEYRYYVYPKTNEKIRVNVEKVICVTEKQILGKTIYLGYAEDFNGDVLEEDQED